MKSALVYFEIIVQVVKRDDFRYSSELLKNWQVTVLPGSNLNPFLNSRSHLLLLLHRRTTPLTFFLLLLLFLQMYCTDSKECKIHFLHLSSQLSGKWSLTQFNKPYNLGLVISSKMYRSSHEPFPDFRKHCSHHSNKHQPNLTEETKIYFQSASETPP